MGKKIVLSILATFALFGVLMQPMQVEAATWRQRAWGNSTIQWRPITFNAVAGNVTAGVNTPSGGGRQIRMLIEFRLISNNSWTGQIGNFWENSQGIRAYRTGRIGAHERAMAIHGVRNATSAAQEITSVR